MTSNPIHAVSGARRGRRRGLVPLIGGAAFVALLLGGVAFMVADVARLEIRNATLTPISAKDAVVARPIAQARWKTVHARLVARLDQDSPLELGAVWATRSGRTCGLVNGRGSFGGLTAMTRFYADGDDVIFNQDHRVDFASEWFACSRDRWIVLNQGSDETGFCASRLGEQRCTVRRVTIVR